MSREYHQAAAPAVLVAALLLSCTADSPGPVIRSVGISPGDSVHFPAINDSVRLAVSAVDSDGAPVLPGSIQFTTRNPGVASVSAEGWVRSVGDGSTFVLATVDDVSDSVRVTVTQARDSLVVTLAAAGSIVSLAYQQPFPLTCRAFDAAGGLLPTRPTVTSATGRIVGTDCDSLQVASSGLDTLTLLAPPYQAVVPVAVAILPEVLTAYDAPVLVDSIPRGSTPWAPTLHRNHLGGWDLYFTAYFKHQYPVSGQFGDLHRLASQDGRTFRYDGVALRRDPSPCDLQGSGIENIAIVPRADSAGWRMFLSAGSFDCYGWQVFSAVSADQRVWQKEPGVRIPNGGTLPPAEPELPPWPAGEGMVIDQLPGGAWRMIASTYEHITPPENRFQITEWHSPDQLAWTYAGPVLTTRQVGALARRSVYSPVIHELAPGLSRMYFTGDNLDVSNGGSRIFTAVSRDRRTWQVEGPLLDEPDADFFYSTMVDSTLVFIRRDARGRDRLGSVQVRTR